jgi:formate dehydrogenase alpha subunit
MIEPNSVVTITIDGRRVEAAEGKSVLEAALDAGVYIPNLCWQKGLEGFGGCRLCIVKVAGMRGMPPACTTNARDGMVVESDTEEVNSVRRVVAELLIADHPRECLSCTSNQRCDLQKVASYLGVEGKRLRSSNKEVPVDDSNPCFVRDLSKCILCGRCVRVCHDVRNVGAIDFAFRGHDARIATAGSGLIIGSTCETCGACVDACPTSALRAKGEHLPPSREVKTTCTYCGCGCSLYLGARGGRIVSARGDEDGPANAGNLCVKGRFGYEFVNSSERLTTPLIKRDGEFVEASWDEAFDLIAEKFAAAKGDRSAAIASAKCTNEDNYVFQKFTRTVMSTNNIDHCARI